MSGTIALIAHDNQQDQLVVFVQQHQALLSRYQLIATATTGQRLEIETNLPITKMLSASQGGDIQIAASVANGEVSVVIFLVDPFTAQSQEPDFSTLLRICNIHDVPLATNLATATKILEALRNTRIAHLIFNPVSGQGNSQQELQLIKDLLKVQMQLVVHLTTPEISAEQLAQKALAAEADLIIASGGDGTVSAVAGVVMNTGVPFGVIPRGTANAFASAIGIPNVLTPIRSSCEVILAGQTRVVDMAMCNNQAMVLLAGIGYEAEMVEKADRETKNRWGALAYLMAGWKQLDEQELFDTEITIENAVKNFQAGAITVANAAPPTSVLAHGLGEVICDDGLLDVTIITASEQDTKLEAIAGLLKMLGAALIKTPPNDPSIFHLRTRKLKITTKPWQKVVLDGEIIEAESVEIECIPHSLKVFAPISKG